MEEVATKIEDALAEAAKPKGKKLKTTLYLVGAVVVLALVVQGAAFAYAWSFNGQVYSGVAFGNYELGGMNKEEVVEYLEGLNNRLAKEGVILEIKNKEGFKETVKLNTLVGEGDNFFEIVKYDSEMLGEWAISRGRGGNWFAETWQPIWLMFRPVSRPASLAKDDARWEELVEATLQPYEDPYQNANVEVENWREGKYKVIEEKIGNMFDTDVVKTKIETNLENLVFLPLAVETQVFTPLVKQADVEKMLPELPKLFAYGEIGLNYINPQTKLRKDWTLKPEDYSSWLEVVKDENNDLIFGLNQEKVSKYLEDLRMYVDQPAESGRFVMENDKVKEFKGSQTGITLDALKTYEELNRAFKARNYEPGDTIKTVALVTEIVEPEVKLGDANDLGITDIIGVGYSTFRDSHNNRIKNIAHAVQRLNGVLIKPDEEFSANHYAGPYTAENGYLPEAVIKGNEIKDEIGGGMCQIGTTLFRMAMNSGMDITQRRNHSLVVSYYADPVNGNPGTDATLYEPILDLKFKNDTGNYLLLQTDIDYKKQLLTFTLWGKPDGRTGSYTHPFVSKWIPAGAPQVIKSEKLAPGKKDCQAAFRGAVASFTYTRITPTGEKIDRVFDSYYRPLPQICLVGVDPNEVVVPPPVECPEGEVCEPVAPVEPVIDVPNTTTTN